MKLAISACLFSIGACTDGTKEYVKLVYLPDAEEDYSKHPDIDDPLLGVQVDRDQHKNNYEQGGRTCKNYKGVHYMQTAEGKRSDDPAYEGNPIKVPYYRLVRGEIPTPPTTQDFTNHKDDY